MTLRILVTGATSGIGLETARALAAAGHSVWVHGRSDGSVNAAVEDILSTVPRADLHVAAADLASLDAVRSLAEALKPAELDVLVHNAGVFMQEPISTVDGFEMTWAVNHLAPFLLTSLLLDGLLLCPAARVINVSSMGHHSGRIRFDDVNLSRGYDGVAAYCQSKLANVLFTRELARRTQNSSLVTHSLHPGVVRTKLLDSTGFGNQPAVTWAKGAETSVFLAVDPDAGRTSGDYFVDRARRPSKPASADVERRLWALSELQTGLRSAG